MKRKPGKKERKLSFLEHFEELRHRILIIFVIVIILSIALFAVSDQIIKIITLPLEKNNLKLKFYSITEPFITRVKASVLTSVFLSFPIILWQLLGFVTPALKKREKKIILPSIILAVLLFITGLMFCYFIVLPAAVKFLLKFVWSDLEGVLRLSYNFSFLLIMLLTFGLIFQFPAVTLLLMKLNIITRETLLKSRKYVIVSAFVISAFLTPPDVFTQIMLALPLIVLFELTTFLTKYI